MRKAAPLLLLILAGVLTFHWRGIPVTSDLNLYMSYARNLALGNGYADFNGELTLRRGPGFALMIQWAWWLLGSSTESALWVVRIFCIANPIVVYWLGKRLFNGSVGFAAGLSILTSYSVSYSSYRHLDPIWPFFAFASVLFLYRALERERLSFAVAAGLLSGASFLVKESAVLLFPLPIVLVAVVREFRTGKNLVHSLAYLGVVLLTIAPWLYWTRETGISGLNRMTETLGSDSSPMELGRLFFTGLADYYRTQLSPRFSVAPLFLVAWGFVLIRALGRSTGCKVCIACLALLAPYAAYVATEQMRAGQLVVLFLLNYLAASFFLYSIAEWLATRLSRGRSWTRTTVVNGVFSLTVLPVLLFQLFATHEQDRGGASFLKSTYSVHRRPDTKGHIRDVVTWFEKHATRDAVIFVGDGGFMEFGRTLFLESEGNLRLRGLPVVVVRFGSRLRRPAIRSNNRTCSIEQYRFPPLEDLLYFERQVRTPSKLHRAERGYLLYESHLLTQLDAHDAEYVVVGPNFHFLGDYFRANDSFSQVASAEDGRAQIFKVVRGVHPAPHPVFVGNRYLRSDDWIELLTERVGLPESDMSALESARRPPGFVLGLPFKDP